MSDVFLNSEIRRLEAQIDAMSKRHEQKVQHDAEIIHKLLTKLKIIETFINAGTEVGNDE